MVCPIPKSTPREIFLSSICSSLSESTFVKITFGDKRAGEKDLKNIFAKRIRIKSGEYLSFTYRYATKDIVKNYPFDEAISMIDGWI